jgi:hypothetical protein
MENIKQEQEQEQQQSLSQKAIENLNRNEELRRRQQVRQTSTWREGDMVLCRRKDGTSRI